MSRFVSFVGSVLAAAILGSSADAEAQGLIRITNRVSGLCLGVRGVDQHSPGTEVEVYHCQPGGADRGWDNQWSMAPVGDGSMYFINRVSSLCLGVRGVDQHGPGTGVEVYYCQPGGGDAGLDNRWRIDQLGTGYVNIRNVVSGLCLGVRGVDSHTPGTGVEVYHCQPGGGDAGLDNQWLLSQVVASRSPLDTLLRARLSTAWRVLGRALRG